MSIMTASQTRELAKNLGVKLNNKSTEQDNIFQELVNTINDTSLAETDNMEEIGALLSLPDNQFVLLAPVFIEELEKSYNQENTQLLMVKAMNTIGRKVEDIEEEYLALCDVIDSQTEPLLTAPKRDFLKTIVGLPYNAIASMDGIAKKIINIPIEYCNPDAKMPAYAHASDSGMDVYALEEITINPGETKLVPLGIKVAIPLGYELQVRPKSGCSLRTKLRIANAPGTIDAGYRDELAVIVENVDPPIRAIHPRTTIMEENGHNSIIRQEPIVEGDIEFGQSYTIGKGEKFAQLVLCEIPKVAWVEVDTVAPLGEDRGGGFGSTGLK